MSVHRCLLVSELLRLICEELIDGPASSLGSLAALAATSRALQKPALDALWSDMVDLVPLIKCMPQDLWEEWNDTSPQSSSSEPRRLLVFRRAIVPSDWNRFIVHCPRVQKLGILPQISGNRGTKIYIDPSVFEAITLATNSSKLLPNLRELSWDSESDIFPYIHLLLSPKITKLQLCLDGCTGTRLSLIPSLVNVYPEITHVELSSSAAWQDLHLTAVSDALCRWNNLRVLTVVDLNDKALLHVASLPNLRHLEIDSLSPVVRRAYDASPSSKREVGFPSLTKLRITAERIENCVGLIELMSSCPLYQLEVFLEGCRSPVAHWKTFFEAMEKHCLPTAVKYIFVEEEGKFNRDVDVICDYIMRFDHFKALLHFPNAIQIILRPFYGFSLTPDAVRAMATGWLRIRRLTLGTKTRASQGIPGITINDLVPFAEFCPILDHLGIVFDARSPKTTYMKPGGGYFNDRLQRLHVGDSPITNSDFVAAFLSDIFPNLSAISTIYDQHADGLNLVLKTKWAEAKRMTSLFATVRIQEQQHHSVNEDDACTCDHR